MKIDFGAFNDVVKPYGRVACNYNVYKYGDCNDKPLYKIDASVAVIPGIVEVSNNENGFNRCKIDSGYFGISVSNINVIVVDMYPINSYDELLNSQAYRAGPMYSVQKRWDNLQCVYWTYDYCFAADSICDMRLEYWFELTDDNADSTEFALDFDYKVIVKRGFLTKNFTEDRHFKCKL